MPEAEWMADPQPANSSSSQSPHHKWLSKGSTEQLGLMVCRLTVQKEGPNTGREFYGCPKPRGEGCGFFQWVDDVQGGGRGEFVLPAKTCYFSGSVTQISFFTQWFQGNKIKTWKLEAEITSNRSVYIIFKKIKKEEKSTKFCRWFPFRVHWITKNVFLFALIMPGL